jgi:hypothetical protein
VSNLIFARSDGLRDESSVGGAAASSSAEAGGAAPRAASQLLPHFAAFVFSDIASSGPRLRDARVFSGLFDARDDNIAVPRGDADFDPEATGNASLPFVRAPYVMAPLSLQLLPGRGRASAAGAAAAAAAAAAAGDATCRHALNLEPAFLHLDPLYGASAGVAGTLLVRASGGLFRMRFGANASAAGDSSPERAEAVARLAPFYNIIF